MDKGKIIKELRIQNKMTQDDLAKVLGTTKQTIYKYENGIITNIPSDNIKKIAECFNVSPLLIMGMDDELPSNIIQAGAHRIPILGTICAGDGIVMEEHYTGSIITDQRVDADYALYVKGNSMQDADIFDGDLIYIRKVVDFENGLIYAVGIRAEDEALLRRVYRQEHNNIMLVPCNKDYQPMILGEDEVFIIGKAVGIYREIQEIEK